MRRTLYILLCAALLLVAGKFSVLAQDVDIVLKGVVYSAETGMPLSDINIVSITQDVEPAYTDSSGHFYIILKEKNDHLQISYPGFKDKSIYIDGQTEISVWLLNSEDRSQDDLISLVNKTTRGSLITGAVSTGNNINYSLSINESVDQLLQGKIAGLNSISRSGMPGSGSYMHLRGYNSLFSAGIPLIVIDGMIVRNEGFPGSAINGFIQNPLSDINPNNISSVTVLKDAIESAPYGIKGSNGVILISTNPPESGKTTMDVTVSGGISSFSKYIPLMTPLSFKSYLMEQMYSEGLSSDEIFSRYPFMTLSNKYLYYEKYNNSTNWQQQIFSQGLLNDANIRVKGGDERAIYTLSGGYLRHEGIISNTSYNRFNFQFNSRVKVSSKVNIGVNLRLSNSKYNLMESGSLYQTNPVYASLIKAPFLSVYEQNSEGVNQPVTEDKDIFGNSNPYVIVNKLDAGNTGFSFLGSSFLEFKPVKNLTFHINLAIDRDKNNEKYFSPSWGIAPQGDGSAERSMKNKLDQSISAMNENYVSYSIDIANIHNFTITAGSHLSLNHIIQNLALAQNSATDEFRNLNNGKTDERSLSGYDENWNWLNYYLTASYSLKERYLVSFGTAIDGSSRFGKETKGNIYLVGYPFALTRSVGLSWIISGEPFIRDLSLISLLKIRATTGSSGSDEFGNDASRFRYVSIPYYSVTGLVLAGISNQALRWEKVQKNNLGFDLSIFKERILLTMDFFRNTISDMIMYSSLPVYYGYNNYPANSGECKNTGMEINTGVRILNGRIKWDMNVMYSTYNNQVTSLPDGPVLTSFTGGEKISMKGQPMGMFYGYKFIGVFSTQAEADAANLADKAGRRFNAGDAHFADIDKNHIINENDRTIIGNPHPDYTASVFNRFTFKRFELNFELDAVHGNTVFNYMRSGIESMNGYENQSTAVYDRWMKDGQKTEIPRAIFGDPIGNSRFSNRWLEDGSFIRLRNITLSYSYLEKLLFANYLTIYITASNLLISSPYLGYDPEFSYANGVLGQGIDYGQMPQPKSVLIGLKLGL
jgi:TonB-linked SusC/RagA family outer membrane protein